MESKKKKDNIQAFAFALRRIKQAVIRFERAKHKKQWEDEKDEAGLGESWFGFPQEEMADALEQARGYAREIHTLLAANVPLPDSINRERVIRACEALRQDDDFDTPEVRKAIDSTDYLLRAELRKGDKAYQETTDEAESEQDTYNCQERIRIGGELDNKGRNIVMVNDSMILLGHRRLHLLLIFVAGLKNSEEGWIDPEELAPLKFDPALGKYQPLSVLRQKLEPALLECDPQRLFELGYDREGARHYRLSVQPDLITCNWVKLLNHPDVGIRTLASTIKKDAV